jgi:glucose/arabinose dehydrogenase
MLLLVAGCADDEQPEASRSGTPSTTSGGGTPGTSGEPSTTPDATARVPAQPPALTLTELARFDSLTDLTVHPESGHLYLAERVGRVQRIDLGAPDDAEEIIDISEFVTTDVERGLLGLAIAPDGDHLYLSYSGPDGETRLDEVALSDDGTALTDQRREVFTLEQPFPNHNGGDVAFGPDGMLYLALGDGGAAADPLGAGQDTNNLLGKILRIDPLAAGDGARTYGIPDDNPFVDGGGAPEVWLWGVRNPWRISWDRATDDLWVADVGQGEWEEVNLLPAPDAGRGLNLGWNEMEGFETFEDGRDSDAFTAPVHAYDHSDGRCSVTGGVVYRGEAIPALKGIYLFSDYCVGRIEGLRAGSDRGRAELVDLGLHGGDGNVVGFGEDLAGEVYVIGLDGTLSRIDSAPA